MLFLTCHSFALALFALDISLDDKAAQIFASEDGFVRLRAQLVQRFWLYKFCSDSGKNRRRKQTECAFYTEQTVAVRLVLVAEGRAQEDNLVQIALREARAVVLTNRQISLSDVDETT